MEIRTKKLRVPAIPSSDYFSGDVSTDSLMSPQSPARARSIWVTFQPEARTAWHTHPLGQTLIITEGSGFVQSWGDAARLVEAGDVIWFEPGEKHWHGAGPKTPMTHIAIQEALDGVAADWLEHVSRFEYEDAVSDLD